MRIELTQPIRIALDEEESQKLKQKLLELFAELIRTKHAEQTQQTTITAQPEITHKKTPAKKYSAKHNGINIPSIKQAIQQLHRNKQTITITTILKQLNKRNTNSQRNKTSQLLTYLTKQGIIKRQGTKQHYTYTITPATIIKYNSQTQKQQQYLNRLSKVMKKAKQLIKEKNIDRQTALKEAHKIIKFDELHKHMKQEETKN